MVGRNYYVIPTVRMVIIRQILNRHGNIELIVSYNVAPYFQWETQVEMVNALSVSSTLEVLRCCWLNPQRRHYEFDCPIDVKLFLMVKFPKNLSNNFYPITFHPIKIHKTYPLYTH